MFGRVEEDGVHRDRVGGESVPDFVCCRASRGLEEAVAAQEDHPACRESGAFDLRQFEGAEKAKIELRAGILW